MTQAHPLRQWATEVFQIESEAIAHVLASLDETFEHACELMLATRGRVVVTGMGKSGHIANKMAATLASTGTPAFFVHPAEASHGDLGMITAEDVVIAISNSGETSELTGILPVIKRIGAKLVGISKNPESTLGRYSDLHLQVAVPREACPHDLAPTSSTTATLVLGDALAITLLQARGFSKDDFALSHPGGALGKRLLTTLKDIMHADAALPVVTENATLGEALVEMSAKGLGMTCVVTADGELSGLFTDGDLRRVLQQNLSINDTPITQVMTRKPITAVADILAAEALKLMEDKSINGLIIVDERNQPVGAMNMQDLLKAGVI